MKKLKTKNIMTIIQLMELHNLTIHELIEIIKLRGESLEYGILSIPNNKYIERFLILFEYKYYVIYEILDTFEDICHHEDIIDFVNENEARIQYNNLLIEHNGIVYE